MTEQEEVEVLYDAIEELAGEKVAIYDRHVAPSGKNWQAVTFMDGGLAHRREGRGPSMRGALRDLLYQIVGIDGPGHPAMSWRSPTTEELLGMIPETKAHMAGKALGARE